MGRAIFPDLVGNEKIKNNLALDAAAGKTAHAYIIEGEEGSGRHLTARLVSAATVCENRRSASHPLPCGICSSCRKILSNISADVTVIGTGGRATIGVDAIRKMREDLYVTPNDSEKKFYIIEQAEKMTVQAQNALLLSLEEPPGYVIFFLITTHSAGLLETIRSRAPVIRMEVFSPKVILDLLLSGKIADLSAYTEGQMTEAAFLSGGAIGRAVELLTEGNSAESLRTIAANFTEGLCGKKRSSELLEYINEHFPTDRESVLKILTMTQTALRDIIAHKKTEEMDLLFYLREDDIPTDAARVSPKKLLCLCNLIRNASETVSMNGSVNTALTEIVLSKDKC